MIVYRLELPDGTGPYSQSVWNKWMDKSELQDMRTRHNYDNAYPTINKEFPKIQRDFKKNELCGCVDISQLFHWFKPVELKTLKSLGFKVARYEIAEEHIIFGKYQCLFDINYAERVN